MGPHTLRVPADLFVLNRKRLCDRLRKVAMIENNAVILLQGGNAQNLYDTDVEHIFRQVSHVLQLRFALPTAECEISLFVDIRV